MREVRISLLSFGGAEASKKGCNAPASRVKYKGLSTTCPR